MDRLDELTRRWNAGENYDSDVQRRIWDRRAQDFSEHPLPAADTDPFLVLMREEHPLTSGTRVLDLGCGAGGYSIALSPLVGEAAGTDISPEMIRAASRRAVSEGVSNCSFVCCDWTQADIDSLGYRGNFDIVFAHMTPAVCDSATLEKMDSCSTDLCMIQKPARRTNRIQDICYREAGIPGEASLDEDIADIFCWLWFKGYEPRLSYAHETWESPMESEKMLNWITDRIRLKTQVDEELVMRIKDVIAANTGEDGMVGEVTDTSLVTILWHKCPR